MKISDRQFSLRINVPAEDETYTQAGVFHSSVPFPAISKGDLIDPRRWEDDSFNQYLNALEYGGLLEVVSIVHLISQSPRNHVDRDGLEYVVEVYTRPVSNR